MTKRSKGMPEFRSEIRDSELLHLSKKVVKGSYTRYLKRITLRRVRAFTDRIVTLDFPVTALIGPNGGGKSTILGSAALAYKEVAPGDFFTKSGKYDASMKGWSIEYEVIDRTLNKQITIQRTASFPQLKWNRKALDRKVLVFGVSRTVPASERKDLSKASGNSFTAAREINLSAEVIEAAAKILGKKIDGYSRLYVDLEGRVSLFAAKTATGSEYSEFHFGAGEASVIRMVLEIEESPDEVMILIEEIENGLHPVATRRMVEYLIEVARRKSAQVIFTTHSNDALDPLPPNAIWAAYDGDVLQGKLDIRALRTITGQIDAKLAIFVEDEFGVRMTTTALRYSGGIELDAIKIHSMSGANPAVSVNVQHNQDPTRTFDSVCLLDGDQKALADPDRAIYTLPGDTPPDVHVFDSVLAKLESVVARLTVSMQLPSGEQERVKRVIESRATTNRDRHVIFQQIGDDLDFTSEIVVSGAFLAVWAQEYPDEVRETIEQFADRLPRQ